MNKPKRTKAKSTQSTQCTCEINTTQLYLHYPDCPYRKSEEARRKKDE